MTTIPIKIIDKPCGCGKTTEMINSFNKRDKYLVIVPLLSEVERIVEESKEVGFVQPDEFDNTQGTKYANLKLILSTVVMLYRPTNSMRT